jgi:serine O-acetyltransferase
MTMFENFRADLDRYTYCASDRSKLFVLLTQQGLWALAEYRFSHWVRNHVHWPIIRPGLQTFGFIWHKLIEITTGIDLPSRAVIGKGLLIPHFGETIVNCNARIGDYCTISQGVTIGSAGRGDKFGVPVIGNRVYIAPGVKIIGAITIGDDVAIGANAVVTKDLPDRSVAVGIPAKVISADGSEEFITYPPAYRHRDQSITHIAPPNEPRTLPSQELCRRD